MSFGVNVIRKFLPAGKKAAICFSMDDVHPGKSSGVYDAGGDLASGKLGMVQDLLNRHRDLKLTIFLTADWRMISPFPTRKLLAAIPYLRDRIYLAPIQPKGTNRLHKHPEFLSYLKQLPNMDIAFHGLYHCHKGLKTNLEFQNQGKAEFLEILQEIEQEFKICSIDYAKGLCPPNWLAPEPLVEAMVENNFNYLASARDLFTAISPDAKANMSGLKGVSLIYPELIANRKLVHIPENFNATRSIQRAIDIIENNGILSIKAHIVKDLVGHILYDGVDEVYMNYIDTLLIILKDRYGDQLWFASMDEIAKAALQHANQVND